MLNTFEERISLTMATLTGHHNETQATRADSAARRIFKSSCGVAL